MENEKHSQNRNKKKTKLKRVVKSIDLGSRKKNEEDEISSKYSFLKDKDMAAPKKQSQKAKRPNSDKSTNKTKQNKNTDSNNKKGNKKKKKLWKKILLILLALIIIGIIAIASFVTYIFKTDKWAITKEQLLADAGAEIYNKDNEKIATLTGSEVNKKLELSQMGKIPDAFIAIEDERFYKHNGVDLKRTLGAVLTFVKNRGNSSYGGSTITQQLVKITMNDDSRKGMAGIERKIREWSRAIQVDKMLGKDNVLNRYLNRIFLGSASNGLEIRGVEAAANFYFNKSSKDLSTAQAAFIAGINHAPSLYNPFKEEGKEKVLERAKNRTLTVIGKMHQLKKIDDEEYNKAVKEVNDGLKFEKGSQTNGLTGLSFTTTAAIDQIAKQIKEKQDISYSEAREIVLNSGYKIYTTEDSKIQKVLNEEYAKSRYVKKSNGQTAQSAMVVIDPPTGRVLGTAGSLEEKPDTLGLNRIFSERQVGSTFKPIGIVGPALEAKETTAATVYYDHLTTFGKNYTPHNDASDGDNNGIVSMRRALTISLNIPMIKLLSIMGYEKPKDFLKKMDINVDTEKAGLSLALGTESITPLKMAAAYAMIANKGVYNTPTFYTKVVDQSGNTILEPEQKQERVMSEENAYILTSMMEDVIDDGTASSFGKVLGQMAVAGKTGTTTNAVDRWFCGFTPYYAAAVWYGADNGYQKTASFWGRNPAAAIWFPTMKRIHEDKELKKNFDKPEGIVTRTVDKATGKLASSSTGERYDEIFSKDNIPGKSEGSKAYTICKDTKKLATKYCQNTETIYIGKVIETEEKGNWTPRLTSGKIAEYCDKHTTPITIDVPNVVGMKLNDAKAKLTEAGFTVVAKINDKAGAAKDEVLTQSATKAEKGTEIYITYNSSGPATNTTKTNTTTNTTKTNTTTNTTTTNTTTNTTP